MSINYKNTSLILILFLMIFTLYAQNKESIIIRIMPDDIKSKDSCLTSFNLKQKIDSVYLLRHKLNFNCYNNKKTKVQYSSIKHKIILANEALTLVNKYLALKTKECEKELGNQDKTPCKLIMNPPAFNYNSYFKKIYLYEPINKNEGYLYEVTWDWFIEN